MAPVPHTILPGLDQGFVRRALADLDADLGMLRQSVDSLLGVLRQERLDPPAKKVRHAVAVAMAAVLRGELVRRQLLERMGPPQEGRMRG